MEEKVKCKICGKVGLEKDEKLLRAVADIKEAILQGQYEACKGVNRIQLAVYFGIGKYISQHTRKGVWGTGALETISDQLRRELPGLRGYSATALKNMRKFYENWVMLDPNSSVTTDELEKSTITIADINSGKTSVITDDNSAIAIVELVANQKIDIHHTLQISDIKDFPVEDFFRLPFTHHIRIIEGTKELKERYYFIHRAVEENIPSDDLPKFIKNNPYDNQKQMPSNFTKTISNAAMMRKAVMMFKDEYLLDFINVEEIGVRDSIDVDERVVEKEIVNKVKNFIMTNGHADFYFLAPGTYYLRLFRDLNGNGTWDTGDYDLNLQPEPLYYYPSELSLKAQWEITQEWNPTAIPLAKQKPQKITKQKPDKERTIKNRNAERSRK